MILSLKEISEGIRIEPKGKGLKEGAGPKPLFHTAGFGGNAPGGIEQEDGTSESGSTREGITTAEGSVQRGAGSAATAGGAVQREAGSTATAEGAVQREAGSTSTAEGAVQREEGAVQRGAGSSPMEVESGGLPHGGVRLRDDQEGPRQKVQRTGDPQGSPSHGLFPPHYAGVRQVHGYVEVEDLIRPEWIEAWGEEAADEDEEEDDEKPPQLTEEELANQDLKADLLEVNRLLEMGVLRYVTQDDNLEEFTNLTTRIVRDRRKRPRWTRRSRLVAREFKWSSPWTAELFAPSSSLGVTHAVMAVAHAEGLELVTLDIKDAYLNVDQKAKVIIKVAGDLVDPPQEGYLDMVLLKTLPGQRIAAAEWYDFTSEGIKEAKMENYIKELTLFRSTEDLVKKYLCLHADDGLLAAAKEEREKLVEKLEEKVKVQVSSPLKEVGTSLEFSQEEVLQD